MISAIEALLALDVDGSMKKALEVSDTDQVSYTPTLHAYNKGGHAGDCITILIAGCSINPLPVLSQRPVRHSKMVLIHNTVIMITLPVGSACCIY